MITIGKMTNTPEYWSRQYMNIWTTNSEPVHVCGECKYFGPRGCTTSQVEAKYGSKNTPACTEFELSKGE